MVQVNQFFIAHAILDTGLQLFELRPGHRLERAAAVHHLGGYHNQCRHLVIAKIVLIFKAIIHGLESFNSWGMKSERGKLCCGPSAFRSYHLPKSWGCVDSRSSWRLHNGIHIAFSMYTNFCSKLTTMLFKHNNDRSKDNNLLSLVIIRKQGFGSSPIVNISYKRTPNDQTSFLKVL